jgi:hypothetical protein
MSSAEDGYCSSDSPRAESPEEAASAAADVDAESPRANKRERDLRDLHDLPASPSSPLPAAKRRYGRDSCVTSHACGCACTEWWRENLHLVSRPC